MRCEASPAATCARTGRGNTTRSGSSPTAGYNLSVTSFRYVFTDVFTDTPLAGNQLAVFTDAREIPEERLQPLALEIGFSETVFV
ncbi:MAG: PhzF family phenazine biosynthesis protein, partial [Gaiellaceae bacterium]